MVELWEDHWEPVWFPLVELIGAAVILGVYIVGSVLL